jgi:hypothetical protein
MRAPVFRNIEGKNTFLGLAFPGEALGVLAAFWLLLATLPPRFALPVGIALYLAIRLMGRGRPPKHVQSWIVWQLRRRLSGGRLSAAARARAPRFPFADYASRDPGAGTGREEGPPGERAKEGQP